MKSTWQAEWLSKRPKTLVGDTLSAALKTLDEKVLFFEVDSSSIAVMNAKEACKAATKAAGATKAKCNKVIHKDGIKLIEKIEVDLAHLQSELIKIGQDIQDYYSAIKKIFIPFRQELTAFSKDHMPSKIPATLASVKRLSNQFNALKRPVGLTDVETNEAVSSFFGAVTASLEGLEDTAHKLRAATPGTPEVEKLKHKWAEGIKEVEAQTKKGVNELKKTDAVKRYDLSPG